MEHPTDGGRSVVPIEIPLTEESMEPTEVVREAALAAWIDEVPPVT